MFFQAALASIQPLIASKLEWLQNIIQQANIGNINTCSMAKNIVGGISGQMGIGAYDNCVAVGDFLWMGSGGGQTSVQKRPDYATEDGGGLGRPYLLKNP